MNILLIIMLLRLIEVMTKVGEIYRQVHAKLVDHPTNFSWVIKNQLAGSGLPSSYKHLQWLVKNGIRTVITIREIPLSNIWVKQINSRNNDVDFFFLKTPDYGAPSSNELFEIVEYVDNQLGKNKPVLVHCAAGKGRTGTLLAAYVIKKNGLNPKDAIEKIRLLRPGSIQSESQKKAIELFYNTINKK